MLVDKFNSDVMADTIDLIYNNLSIVGEGQINLNPPYQREVVWSDEKKEFFIDSILKNIVPTNLIFNINQTENERICIDGKQRCTSIKEFIDNAWPVEINGEKFFFGPEEKIKKDIRQEYERYKIFSPSERSEFKYKKIPIVTYKNLKYEDQLEVFGRIQQGCPLTEGEKISCNFIDLKSFNQIRIYFDSFKDNDLIRKYTSFERKKHHKFLFDIMYYLDTGLKNNTKKNFNIFIKKLDGNIKKLNVVINKCTDSIKLVFTKHLLNHPDIQSIKIKKALLIIIIHYLCEKYSNNEKKINDDSKLIRKTIIEFTKYTTKNKIIVKLGEACLSNLQKIYNNIYENNFKILLDIESDNDSSEKDLDESENESSSDSEKNNNKKINNNKIVVKGKKIKKK